MHASMSMPPSDAVPSGPPPAADSYLPDGMKAADGQESGTDRAQAEETPEAGAGGNAFGLLLGLAFGVFVLAYAISGQRAAGIAFWAVMLALRGF